jgi:hypothetical protein
MPRRSPGRPDQGHGVALVHWPEDESSRRWLAASRLPRLLLVRPGVAPPTVVDDIEDWVRFPLDAEELARRSEVLAERARDVPSRPATLVLDEHGVLRHRSRWAALAPLEQRLLAVLLASPGRVVRRSVLRTAGWPGGAPADPRAVDGVVRRIRRRIAPLEVTVHSVGGAGYLLDHGDLGGAGAGGEAGGSTG